MYGSRVHRLVATGHQPGRAGVDPVREVEHDPAGRRCEGGERCQGSARREDVTPPRERANGDEQHRDEEESGGVAEEPGHEEREGDRKHVRRAERRQAVMCDHHRSDHINGQEHQEQDEIGASGHEEDAAVESGDIDWSGSTPLLHGPRVLRRGCITRADGLDRCLKGSALDSQAVSWPLLREKELRTHGGAPTYRPPLSRCEVVLQCVTDEVRDTAVLILCSPRESRPKFLRHAEAKLR